jgi:hypothetical protein
MSAQAPILPDEGKSAPSDALEQSREVLRFLREENAANHRAVRDESDANRRLLLDSLKILAYPLAVLLAVAAFLGFRTFTDMKQTIRTEARNETQAEVERMRKEIRTRLDQQFETKELQKFVKDAAAESTKSAAAPLIKSEVATQVREGVNAERPRISDAVTKETQAAVKQMQPQISKTVKESVDSEIQSHVDPVITRLETLKFQEDIQRLIIRMDNDDAIAFDQLQETSHSFDSESQPLVRNALNEVTLQHDAALRLDYSFSVPVPEDIMLDMLSIPNSGNKRAALSKLKTNPKLTVLKLVELATSDLSLNVRCEANKILLNDRNLPNLPFHPSCLDKNTILRWWEANKATLPDSAK